MKPIPSLCILALMVLTLGTATFADVARPKESPAPIVRGKTIRTNLVVAPDSNVWDARLQISRDSVRQLRAALDNLPADDAMGQTTARSSTRTIMAGLFMFLAVSFGGVWLARSGHGRNQKAVAAVVMVAVLMGATAVITLGNAAPAPGWKWRNLPQNLSAGTETRGFVEIEIVPEGNGIKLIVPMYKVNSDADKKPGEE